MNLMLSLDAWFCQPHEHGINMAKKDLWLIVKLKRSSR